MRYYVSEDGIKKLGELSRKFLNTMMYSILKVQRIIIKEKETN